MERNVVAGYNGDGNARLATFWAAAEAASQGYSLTVAYAVGSPTMPEPPLPAPAWPAPIDGPADTVVIAYAERQLTEIADQCHRRWPHLPVHTRIVYGPPAEALRRAAADAYVLAIGPPEPGQPRQSLRGSTAMRLVDHCDRPVVIVRHAKRHQPTHGGSVVVSIDRSTASTGTLQFAFDYAVRHGCELVAVHAWPDLPPQTPHWPGDVRRDWVNDWDDADWLLTRLLTSHISRHPDIPIRRVVTRDQPTRVLREHALGATLLIIGQHHLVSTMISRPPCPVAIVRH